MDITNTKLFDFGDKFVLHENEHTQEFEWLSFSRLKDEYFYSLFIKEEIYNLPTEFKIRTEIE